MTITLDDELSLWLEQEAKRRGESVNAVAAQMLRHTLRGIPANSAKRHSVMEFAGIGAGRPGALSGMDAQAYIDEQRTEWGGN